MRYYKTFIIILIIAFGCVGPKEDFIINAQVKNQKGKISVNGETNLPDKAQLLISLRNKNKKDVIIQSLPFVKKGKFQALFTPQKLKKGKYEIRIEFSPGAFDWSKGKVPDIVGKKGENLKGPYVKVLPDGTKILEHVIDFSYP